jgi:hypothetical protein
MCNGTIHRYHVTALNILAVYYYSHMKHIMSGWNWQPAVWGGIQKFQDWIDTEINNNNKHSLRYNTKGYGDKTHKTD